MCEVEGRRNFAVNFDTPQDVTTIAGLTVTVQPGQGIRGAVLFRRRLGMASPGAAGAMPMAPAPVASPRPVAPPIQAPPPPPPPPAAPKITLKRPGQG